MTSKIIICVTNAWPFCMQAREAYGDWAIFINVEEDPDKYKEMLVYSKGRTEVPVIVGTGGVSVGFVGDVSL